MSKLYVFGIGGTGARVLRSFTMMMAAGVRLGVDEIIPIIIDPDASNADLFKGASFSIAKTENTSEEKIKMLEDRGI